MLGFIGYLSGLLKRGLKLDCSEEVSLNHALLHEVRILNIRVKLVGPDILHKHEEGHQGLGIDFEVGSQCNTLQHLGGNSGGGVEEGSPP